MIDTMEAEDIKNHILQIINDSFNILKKVYDQKAIIEDSRLIKEIILELVNNL